MIPALEAGFNCRQVSVEWQVCMAGRNSNWHAQPTLPSINNHSRAHCSSPFRRSHTMFLMEYLAVRTLRRYCSVMCSSRSLVVSAAPPLPLLACMRAPKEVAGYLPRNNVSTLPQLLSEPNKNVCKPSPFAYKKSTARPGPRLVDESMY